jgi:hypothetical protein
MVAQKPIKKPNGVLKTTFKDGQLPPQKKEESGYIPPPPKQKNS